VQVNSYFAPYHRPPGEKALDIAARSLEIYNQHFGAYPYTELDVVEAPMRNASGVEFPGIVLIGGFLYDDPSKPTFTIATAHEVAHQWWYNVVGNDVFDEPWLDEGLTTYTSSLYYEFTGGKQMAQGYIQYWQDRYDQLKEQGGDDQITQSLAHFEGLDRPAVYGGVVYTKAALFFNALRAEIGDEAFFKGLQTYYQANQFKIATGDDLLNAFEEAAGRQLDDFYEKWLGAPAG
jgi:aminopeptidase N